MPETERRSFFRPLVEQIPEADLILYVDWNRTDVLPLAEIKAAAHAEQMFSLCESPVNGMDLCFCFRDFPMNAEVEKVLIHAPCNKRLYANVLKRKKIVVDHEYAGVEDWTARISDWLVPLHSKHVILRMTNKDSVLDLKPHEQPLSPQEFGSYLGLTDDADTFIVTHRESYGFSVIDMLVRGIRVLTPPGFLVPELMERFDLPTFSNQAELLSLIAEVPSYRWNQSINKCTNYQDIAMLIDWRFTNACAAS
jgi:hypothetical protein